MKKYWIATIILIIVMAYTSFVFVHDVSAQDDEKWEGTVSTYPTECYVEYVFELSFSHVSCDGGLGEIEDVVGYIWSGTHTHALDEPSSYTTSAYLPDGIYQTYLLLDRNHNLSLWMRVETTTDAGPVTVDYLLKLGIAVYEETVVG